MLEKIKNKFDFQKIKGWLTVRNVGLAVFAFLVLWVTWSGSQTIELNYQLQKKISKLQQENAVLELANENQKLKNEYYKTDQFLELSARRQFGKAAPGETVIIIPKEVALNAAAPLPSTSKPAEPKSPVNKPWYQSNFEAWLDFFFHRQPALES